VNPPQDPLDLLREGQIQFTGDDTFETLTVVRARQDARARSFKAWLPSIYAGLISAAFILAAIQIIITPPETKNQGAQGQITASSTRLPNLLDTR
jgi:hypothetical protein